MLSIGGCYHALLSDQPADRWYAFVYLSLSVRLSVSVPHRLRVPLAPIATTNEHFSCWLRLSQMDTQSGSDTDRQTDSERYARHLAK